jgi:hypothetical protein
MQVGTIVAVQPDCRNGIL